MLLIAIRSALKDWDERMSSARVTSSVPLFEKGCQFMNSKYLLIPIVAIGLLTVAGNAGFAQQPSSAPESSTLPFVSPIFGDNMVLQRNKVDKIWGWSEPGDTVRVQIGNSTAQAVAGADRRWQVEIPGAPAGGPYTVNITGRQSEELRNVLVGDVWLCGGQSNMEFKLRGAQDAEDEIKAADHPEIRFFTAAEHSAYRHSDTVTGSVERCFTGYGRSSFRSCLLFRATHSTGHPRPNRPCGGLRWRNAPAETWTSADTLRQLGGFDAQLAELQQGTSGNGPQYGNYIMQWYDEYDIGLKDQWADPTLDDTSWKSVDVMNGWATLGAPDPALGGLVSKRDHACPIRCRLAGQRFPGRGRPDGFGVDQWQLCRRQRAGGESSPLFSARGVLKSPGKTSSRFAFEDRAKCRLPGQTSRPAPGPRRSDQHSDGG